MKRPDVEDARADAPDAPRPHDLPGRDRFDLSYEISSDIPPREWWEHDRDSAFYFDTSVRRVFDTVMDGAQGRLLDVACGDGSQMRAFGAAGGVRVYGLEISDVLLRDAVRGFAAAATAGGVEAAFVRGAAERLPFASATFDRVVCQGSLDHLAQPRAFLAECARILRPDGRLIIALHNFDSASCRASRAMYRLRGALGVARDDPTGAARPYWQIPENHTFKGTPAVLKRLAGEHLALEHMFGVSMFWLLPAWRRLLRWLPARAADALLRGADRVARRAPPLADMVVSVWRRR